MDWRKHPGANRAVQAENSRHGEALKEAPRETWPENMQECADLLRVLRSRDFLVQIFRAPPPAEIRMSVNRTKIVGGRWADGISWDELQRLKTEAGYPLQWAVEVYPSATDVVDVANIRHLWLLPEPPPFAWFRGGAPTYRFTQQSRS